MKKNKYIALIAALIITAAFIFPVTAYAVDNTEPITVSNTDEIDIADESDVTVETDISESLSFEELMALLQFFNMFGETDIDGDTAEPINESVIPDDTDKAFTPDGQASVVDLAYEGDGKMFYTFKTPAGNVFYLIVDRQRGGDNVYFLNAVTETDLLALAENPDKKDGSTSAIPNTTSKDEPTTNDTDNPNPDTDKPPTQKSSNTGLLIFLLIGAVVLGGVGYYIKIVRPKQQAGIDDEDDDALDENDGEEMQFEDEQPEEADSEYEDSNQDEAE